MGISIYCTSISFCSAQTQDEALQVIPIHLEKIRYWDENEAKDSSDSLSIYNDLLAGYLLKLTSNQAESIIDNTINIGNTYEDRIKAVFKNGAESIISDAVVVEF